MDGRSRVSVALRDGILAETLAQAGLAAGDFRGVQVRYVYEGKEWCDTLLAAPGGVRLVRICTDDARASGAPG